MSHSCCLLPLDPVSWLEVLIRAGGMEWVKNAEELETEQKDKWKTVIDSSVALCAATQPRVFISPHLIGV